MAYKVKTSWTILKLWSGHNFNTDNYKGYNFVNIAHRVIVLDLYTYSNHGLYLYQVSRKHLERFQNYGADTISILIITKEHNSIYIACRVTVLVLCIISYHDLHLYHVS